MNVRYVENDVAKREWTDLETCVENLLVPYQDVGIWDQDSISVREQIDHLRRCLARYMVKKGLTMNDLDEIFYTDITMVEDRE